MSLSIADFQKISNGTYNAGDITLTISGKLDKVNNHVGILKGLNTKTISASTILQVKNAFVLALKNAGIDEARLAEVREELGLPKSGSIKGFDMSSLKPLTRAQTREILDRFAGTINRNAGHTLVSNKWAALKAADDQNYLNHVGLASQTNQKSVADRDAAQKALGREIMDYGIDSIPRSVRKSATFAGLSADDKDKFAKIFSFMLLKGGADVPSIAADAMKKVLIAKYGSGIANKDEQSLFKGLASNIDVTTDLSHIDAELKAAKDAATGAKLKFGFGSSEMRNMSYEFSTTGGLGKLARTTAGKSDSEDFADNFAKALTEKEFLKKIVSRFGEHVKDIGELKIDGEPSYTLKELGNGNTELLLSFDARIGEDKKVTGGTCVMRIEIDPAEKSFISCESKMALEPAQQFTDRDVKPVELHKLQIIENIKNTALAKGTELSDDEVTSVVDQMSKWDDMGPGQMKNFEAWLKNDVAAYVNDCIEGKDLAGDDRQLKFDKKGICEQFTLDSTRAHFKVGKQKYIPVGPVNEGLEDAIFKALPNMADRKLITGLLNQSTVATMVILSINAPDPKRENEEDAPSLRSLDQAGAHVVNFTGEDPITIHQPSNTGDSRYELQVDDKKKTATLTLTTDYAIKCSQNLGDNVFYDNQNTSGIKFGSVSYTYQFTITGLGTGHPQLSSADFGQTITARDM